MFSATRAKTCFENLKKNYTKKRSNVRNAKKSGTSREAVEKAENEFNQFSFLVWLDDFIRPRNSRSSFDDETNTTKPSDDESVDGGDIRHSTLDHTNDFEESEAFQEVDESYSMSPAVTNTYSMSPAITNDPSVVPNDLPPHSKTHVQVKKKIVLPKRNLTETKESEMDKQKLSFLKTINQRMEARDKKQKTEDAEDRYAATIADKLRDLPNRERLLAKHEIENTLFKYQMQALDKENVNNTVLFNNNRVNHATLQQLSTGVPDATTQFYQYQQQNNLGNQHIQACQPLNLVNQPMSPSYSTSTMPSPSFPYNAPQDRERGYENV